jgi:hypothetical protein
MWMNRVALKFVSLTHPYQLNAVTWNIEFVRPLNQLNKKLRAEFVVLLHIVTVTINIWDLRMSWMELLNQWWATGWTIRELGFNYQQGQEIFYLLHSILTGYVAHPSSSLLGCGGGSFPGVKQLGHEVDPSPPSCVKAKNTGIYTSSSIWHGV